ncbi:MAG: tRNA epoxyqueuosine(34) reductase QueG [Chitinophagales bacterium]|nr:tRNA epoxyqueuosine(34) reductase QueG [Bacteroidota bacterium]MCB9256418.1 tRNA epoxyqueuosine(34) reductase QueG [Chitinophagales bacterium]
MLVQSNTSRYTQLLKLKAKELGFEDVGISKAAFLEDEARKLEAWLHQNQHGEMAYMDNHFELRTDPRKLLPGAKSVVSLSYNYFPGEHEQKPEAPKLAKYAYGKDYHKVLKKKLKALIQYLEQEIGAINGRAFVDSAPVMERVWAQKSGLGWIGKNTLLLSKGKGSFFFLAELILDIEFEYDGPVKDYCGSCTKCLDACPTNALFAPYQMDASKCISYLTIELKDKIPSEFQGKMENWMYGCDICQDVCPINARAKAHQEPAFVPKEDILAMGKQDWEELTEDVFEKLFEGSAVKRAKYAGLKRNIFFLKEK